MTSTIYKVKSAEIEKMIEKNFSFFRDELNKLRKQLADLKKQSAINVDTSSDSQSTTTSSCDNQSTTTSTDTESHVPSDDPSWHPSDTSNSSEPPYCPPTQDISSLTSSIPSDDVTTLESESSSPKSHLSSTSTTDLSPTPKLKSLVDSPHQPHLVQSIQSSPLPEPEPPPCDRLLEGSPRYARQPHALDTDSEDDAKPRSVNMLTRRVLPDYDSSSETDELSSTCSSESDHVSDVSGSQPHHSNNNQVASNGDFYNYPNDCANENVYDSDDANTGDQSESNDDDSSDHSDDDDIDDLDAASTGDLLSDY